MNVENKKRMSEETQKQREKEKGGIDKGRDREIEREWEREKRETDRGRER